MAWKRLKHKNIVPLLCITVNPCQLVSEWMPGGDLKEYIGNHPTVNRLGLVSVPPLVIVPALTSAASYVMLLKASNFSTPAAWFMVTSKG